MLKRQLPCLLVVLLLAGLPGPRWLMLPALVQCEHAAARWSLLPVGQAAAAGMPDACCAVEAVAGEVCTLHAAPGCCGESMQDPAAGTTLWLTLLPPCDCCRVVPDTDALPFHHPLVAPSAPTRVAPPMPAALPVAVATPPLPARLIDLLSWQRTHSPPPLSLLEQGCLLTV
jgi:hypothetical protein